MVSCSHLLSENPRALITALGVGQICGWGTLYYSFPLIAESMMTELGWTRTDVYGAATLGLVLAAFLAYPVGIAIDKGFGKVLMSVSSLIAAAFFVMWSQVSSLVSFYFLIAGIGALQAALLYEPAFALVARRVGAGKARSGITAITLWGGFASTVFIPFVQLLLDQAGWRGALLTLGIINFLVCTPLYFHYIRPEKDTIDLGSSSDETKQIADKKVLQTALRKPAFWLLMLALTAYAGAFTAFTFHMYPMLLETGISTESVVWAIATIGPAQVLGRILISVFAKNISIRHIGSFVTAVFPIVFIVLGFQLSNIWLITAACITYGVCNGIFTIVRGLVVPEMISQQAYGALNGLLSLPSTLARALAPVAAALIWSSSLSYQGVLWAIAVCTVVLTLSFWMAAWASRSAH